MNTTPHAALLSDDEIAQCINLACTNLFDRSGTTSFKIARSIEQAILAKLQATQEPVHATPGPMFWVRLRSDGGYEGPIHNAVIEDVRRMSGAWHPLYLGSEPVQAGELPDEREAFEAWAQKRLQLNIERCAPPEQGFYTWQSTMDAWMAWQARAALSATQPAQAAQSDAASEAFSAMADAVPFHNGWVKPQAAQGEPVARWITHARL